MSAYLVVGVDALCTTSYKRNLPPTHMPGVKVLHGEQVEPRLYIACVYRLSSNRILDGPCTQSPIDDRMLWQHMIRNQGPLFLSRLGRDESMIPPPFRPAALAAVTAGGG